MRARIMAGVRTTRGLRDEGMGPRQLRVAVARGDVERIRRGAYRSPGDRSAVERHRQLVDATLPGLSDESVLSHVSAAVLYGLPVRGGALGEVHVTRPSKGRRGPGVHVHSAPLVDDEICRLEGIRVTTVDRTLMDLARTEELRWAVVAMDDAVHRGLLTPDGLVAALERAKGLPGVLGARGAVALANGASESVGESLCRVALHQAGLPEPVLQYEIRDATGFVARVDLCWPGQKVVLEFDGRIKYSSRLLRPGERPEDVLWREKRREDRLRALGYLVLRVTWDEIHRDPAAVCRRVAAALELRAA